MKNLTKKEKEAIVALYMKALANEKLSEKCWQRIAKANATILK